MKNTKNTSAQHNSWCKCSRIACYGWFKIISCVYLAQGLTLPRAAVVCQVGILQFTGCCHELPFISLSQPSYQTGAGHLILLGLVLLPLPDVKGPPAHTDASWMPVATLGLLRERDKDSSAARLSWAWAWLCPWGLQLSHPGVQCRLCKDPFATSAQGLRFLQKSFPWTLSCRETH